MSDEKLPVLTKSYKNPHTPPLPVYISMYCFIFQRSPVDNFYNLTPQSAQFQKLLESNMSSAFSIAFAESELIPDDLGFSPAMYMALIDMIQDKPELWQSNHPQKDNLQAQEQLFEDFGKQLIIKFRDTADISVLEKLTGPYVHLVWERLLEKFKEEDSLETVSKWKYYQVGFLLNFPKILSPKSLHKMNYL